MLVLVLVRIYMHDHKLDVSFDRPLLLIPA
jgi:hypothetical protein